MLATLNTLPSYLAYIGVMVGLLAGFTAIYTAITPYREVALIREGNTAAAASLIGTVLGLAVTLASLATHSTHILDMMIWGAIALGCQLAVFFVLELLVLKTVKAGIERGCTAHGVALGGMSLAVGLLNAGAVTP